MFVVLLTKYLYLFILTHSGDGTFQTHGRLGPSRVVSQVAPTFTLIPFYLVSF